MKFSAKAEAMERKRSNNYLNAPGECIEFAYSPAHNTVGCRWQDGVGSRFRIFNIYYPHFGHDELVTDWVSVGPCLPKKSR